MEPRSLTAVSGMLALGAALPVVAVLVAAGKVDALGGLAIGLATGLLNAGLLARKFGRFIAGRESWETLSGSMRRNMLVRFGLIVAIGVAASRLPGNSLLGMAGGLALYVAVMSVYSVAVTMRGMGARSRTLA